MLWTTSLAKMCHRHVFAALTHSLRRLWLPDVVVQFKIRFAKQKKKAVRLDCFLLLVAEVGFEPHDLRVMSPTSYQAALLRDICDCASSLGGAGDRDRTGTILSYHGILSPGRLPVPPHRQDSTKRLFCAPVRFALCIISHFVFFVKPFFAFSFLFSSQI